MSHNDNQIMTKNEFLSAFYKRKPGFYITFTLAIVFFATAVLLLCFNASVLVDIGNRFNGLNDADFLKFILCICSAAGAILGVVFWFVAKRFSNEAADAYSKYLASLEMKPDIKEENLTAGDNEWKCPLCGRVNQNYVGTCGCGEKKN